MKNVYILENNGFILGAFTEVSAPYCWSMVVETFKVKNSCGMTVRRGHELAFNQAVLVPFSEPKKSEFTKITLTDKLGNQWKCIVDDTSDIVQVYGLQCEGYFESEAHHLDTFARDNGLIYESQSFMA